jgi:hypothetical protein
LSIASKTLKKAWAVMKLYSKSMHQKDELFSKQKSMDRYKKESGKKVIVDFITRWWSIF